MESDGKRRQEFPHVHTPNKHLSVFRWVTHSRWVDLSLASQTAGFIPETSSLVMYPGCQGLTVTLEACSHIHSPSNAWDQEKVYVFA